MIDELVKIYDPKKVIHATTQFVDIAGLVKGAASGEGLGNKFLSNIRDTDLILHVLRCFEDGNITHTSKEINPLEDFDVIVTELALKDLESIEKRQEKLIKLKRTVARDPAAKKLFEREEQLLLELTKLLSESKIEEAREVLLKSGLETIPLLTTKRFSIIANIGEEHIEPSTLEANTHYQALLKRFGKESVIPICVKTESELAELDDEEKVEMMEMLGISKSGLDTIIRHSYDKLDLITFFTCGPKEVHAWPIVRGTHIRKASGEIHTDLEKGFICAEVLGYSCVANAGCETKARNGGRARTEGQDYCVQDGDIVLIRFNV